MIKETDFGRTFSHHAAVTGVKIQLVKDGAGEPRANRWYGCTGFSQTWYE